VAHLWAEVARPRGARRAAKAKIPAISRESVIFGVYGTVRCKQEVTGSIPVLSTRRDDSIFRL
jgi:hypothetical protein